MFSFMKRLRSQRTLEREFNKVVSADFPGTSDVNAGYVVSMVLSRDFFNSMFYGKSPFLRSDNIGRPDIDSVIYSSIGNLFFSSISPLVGIDGDESLEVVEWSVSMWPTGFDDELIELAECILNNPGDFAVHSNSIFGFIDRVLGGDGSVDFVRGFGFNVFYTSFLAEAQARYPKIN